MKKDWYSESRDAAKEIFPKDWKLFLGFLAATSTNATVKSNVTLALKAWRQFSEGREFSGFVRPVVSDLYRLITGGELNGPKVRAFHRALLGDKSAIVVDRWMARSYGFQKVTAANFPRIEKWIAEDAVARGEEPTDYQARRWAEIKGSETESFARHLKLKTRQRRLF